MNKRTVPLFRKSRIMPSNKVIKRRLSSVTTTRKIVRALDMVAAAKLQSCKIRLEYARAFLTQAEGIIDGIRPAPEPDGNIYLSPREANTAAYLIITGDRGMCGSYNSNILEHARQHMHESGKDIKLLTIGMKGYDYYRRRRVDVMHRFDDMLETAFYEDAVRISHYLRNLYSSGEAGEVFVAYTKFESAFVHTPAIKRILPIAVDADVADDIRPMGYDPDFSSFLDHAIPAYLNTFIYTALLESIACENAARMLNLDSAVDNAAKIIDSLTRVYNRKRQTAITQEISEIISGRQEKS